MASAKEKISREQLAKIISFEPISLKDTERASTFFTWYFDPQYIGDENIPKDRGVLFVCNHSIYGIADIAALLGAYRYSGRPVRGLADRNHFKIPGWGNVLKQMGAVLGDPQICGALMEDGQSILVFPGGAREVVKKRKETYDLVWKERLGFVRLALQHDYDIVPVGIVGGDEIFNFIADSDDYLQTLLGKSLASAGFFDKFMRGKDELPPIVRGIGLSMAPKPHRLYVSYGKPIRLSNKFGTKSEKPDLLEARELVGNAVRKLIEQGMEARKNDPKPTPYLRRLLQNL